MGVVETKHLVFDGQNMHISRKMASSIPNFSLIPVLLAIPLQHSEGASYFALPTLDRRLLRLSRHLYPPMMAAPGASYDAAMAFSCGVVGELEKGCFADVFLPGCSETLQVRRYVTVAVCTPVITFAERYIGRTVLEVVIEPCVMGKGRHHGEGTSSY